MTTYLCCKDHPSFWGFIGKAYLCCKDHIHFVVLKNWAVLLKPQDGPTKIISQNLSSNLDQSII